LIILGAGLAGSALAWHSHLRGLSVAVVDRLDPHSSSRVAAGLVTPLTGSRSALSWKWREFFPFAHDFYVEIQQKTQEPFWTLAPALRIFRDSQENDLVRSRWITNAEAKDFNGIEVLPFSSDTLPHIKAPNGMAQFAPAARLETRSYLQATQKYFESIASFLSADLDCDRGIDVDSATLVRIPSLQLEGTQIAFCQGFNARGNHYFESLPLHPARGDILVFESRSLQLDRVVHGDAWIVPLGKREFMVGATYDRMHLHHQIAGCEEAAVFRRELMRRVETMIQGTFEQGDHQVTSQRCAVRPASYDRHPLIGRHEMYSNVFCLNGLGSKGTLMAPRLAELLLDFMCGASLDPSLSWNRRK